MLHQDMMYRFHREGSPELDRLISGSRPAEDAEPVISPWALAASVAGNVIAGGAFLGALMSLPYLLPILID